MDLQLQIRPFRFALIQPLRTAAGVLRDRSGWLLRLESRGGRIGWGEVSPLDQALLPRCRRELETLPSPLTRETLEPLLPRLSGAIGFGLGGALAELDGLVGDRARRGWLMAPPIGTISSSARRGRSASFAVAPWSWKRVRSR